MPRDMCSWTCADIPSGPLKTEGWESDPIYLSDRKTVGGKRIDGLFLSDSLKTVGCVLSASAGWSRTCHPLADSARVKGA